MRCFLRRTTAALPGALAISLVHSFFEEAQKLCANPSDDLLAKHPELGMWHQCVAKVHPMNGKHPACDCLKVRSDPGDYDCEHGHNFKAVAVGCVIL